MGVSFLSGLKNHRHHVLVLDITMSDFLITYCENPTSFQNILYCENPQADLAILLWLVALLIIIGWGLRWLFGQITQWLTRSTTTKLDETLLGVIREVLILLTVALGLRLSLNTLVLSERVITPTEQTVQVLFIIAAIWFLLRLYEKLHQTYVVSLGSVIVSRTLFLSILLVSVFLLIRFWIIRPIGCAPECIGINVIGGSLSGFNLRGVQFIQADLGNTDLSEANLQGADLSGANLTLANLKNADLSEAKLIGADLTGADLRNAILEDTDLSGADLSQANLTRTTLHRAKLNGADFTGATLIEVDLSILSDVDLTTNRLPADDPTRTDLRGVKLTQANLTGADLRGARLSGVSLSGADLSGALMTQAFLTGASLNMATLTGVDLSQADLSGSTLIGGNLTSANLTESKLVGAVLVGADLKGANLRAANLTGIRLFRSELVPRDLTIDPILEALNELQLAQVVKNANLSGVGFSQQTQWPRGKLALLSDILGPAYIEQVTAAEPATGEESTPEISPVSTEAQNNIIAAGSSAVTPLTQEIHNYYLAAGYTGTVELNTVGSEGGFRLFCREGQADIVMTSRLINDEEIAACAEIHRSPRGFLVGSEALTVVVNPANSFLTGATLEELKGLFSAERWFDVNTDWPKEAIVRFVPEPGTGAFNLFIDKIFEGDTERLLNAPNTRFIAEPIEQTQGIATDPNAIGFLGHAFYQQNAELLKRLDIDGVAPTAEMVEGEKYILAQPLLLYSDVGTIQQKPAVQTFLDFYLNNVTNIIEGVGYFPVSEKILVAAKRTLQEAVQETLLPIVIPAQLEGNITAAGDSAVFPLVQAMTDRFVEDGFSGQMRLGNINESYGFQLFCVLGESDIAFANRLPTAEETEACTSNNRDTIAFPIGLEVLAVVVNPDNTFLTDVSLQELAEIFRAETWADVNPDWPDESINRFIPEADSEAFVFFVENVFPGEEAPRFDAFQVTSHSDASRLAQFVSKDPNAIGLLSYPDYQENIVSVKIVAIEGVEPGLQTGEQGLYALARPLFLYSDSNLIRQKPQVEAFLTYFLTHLNDVIEQTPYLPISPEIWDQAKIALLKAMELE